MPKALHVLVVEDSPNDHDLVVRTLRKGGFDVTATRVETAETMQMAVDGKKWDAIIADYTMPAFDGMAALELIKKTGLDLPFIVVSGRSDIAVKMLKAGAHDYLNKSDLKELAPMMERELGEAEQRTLRKLAEAKLKVTQEQLNQALESSGLGAFNWNLLTQETWRSPRYDQIFGDPDSTRKLSVEVFLEHVVAEDRDTVSSILKNTVATGGFELECKIARFDGPIISIYARGKVIHDPAGTPLRVVGTIEDITERRKLEEAAREREEMIRLLLDSTAEAIFGVDLQGNCTLANPACARILGYASPDELRGKHMHTLIHHHRADGSVYPEEECLVNEAYRTGKGTHITDEVFWRQDGKMFPAEYFSYPVRRSGEVIGAVVTFLDVSERKTLEEQLRHAQKMEAMGKLASGVAHDFNNILAVIMMQAGLVATCEPMPDEVREFIGEISNAAERAANLTRQLLMFSRRQAILAKDQELNEIVRNMTKMLQRIVGEDVALHFKWSTDRLYAHVDAGMVDQILMNLVVNARDAMPKGGQMIIETSAKDVDHLAAAQMSRGRPGAFVCLSVTDTGCGIPAENMEQIFEPFFTTKAVGKGTGIGLATVFGIVQQHDGFIHVESRVNHGTTFRVFIPRLPGSNTTVSENPADAAVAPGHETILLVEDDADVSKAVECILKQLGYEVLSASNGEGALALWEKHRAKIRLLLTDLVLPDEMNGQELAGRLRAEKAGLKVIYTSGYSAEAVPSGIELREVLNFLSKPYLPQKLSEILRANLD